MDEDISRDILGRLPKHARFVAATVRLIDHPRKRVETDKGAYPYDFLVSSMGCHLDPEAVEGLAEVIGTNSVHTFYTLEGARELKHAISQMKEGRLVIDICDMPIKCPVAPLEFAFLADFYFHEKGIRDRIEISLVTPYAGAFTKPNADRVLSAIAEAKGIRVVANFSVSSVDADARESPPLTAARSTMTCWSPFRPMWGRRCLTAPGSATAMVSRWSTRVR